MLADHMAAVSSYGRKDAPGRYVSIIDLASGKVVSKIDIGEGSKPHGLKVAARRPAARDGRRPEGARRRRSPRGQGPRALPDRPRPFAPRRRLSRRPPRVRDVADARIGDRRRSPDGQGRQGHPDRQGSRGPRRHSGWPRGLGRQSRGEHDHRHRRGHARAGLHDPRLGVSDPGQDRAGRTHGDRHVLGNGRRARLRHGDARREGPHRDRPRRGRRLGDARLPEALRLEPGSGRPADRPRREARVRFGGTRRRGRRHRSRADARRRRLDRGPRAGRPRHERRSGSAAPTPAARRRRRRRSRRSCTRTRRPRRPHTDPSVDEARFGRRPARRDDRRA